MKCWKGHCKTKLEFACPCTNPPVYSCDTHLGAHMKTASKSRHLPNPLIISQNSETKRALITCLYKSLSDLYELRRKTVLDFSMQIKQLNEKMKTTLESFDEFIKKQRKIISEIKMTEVIPNARNTKIDEILASEQEKAIKCLKGYFDIFDESNFFIDDVGKLTKTEPFINESNRFIIFRDNSTKIVQVDLNNFSSAEINVSLDCSKSHYITMCLIPGNSIFCYGNYPTPSNTAFIIESNNNVKQVINAEHSLYISGSIYYNSCVYIFGGYVGRAHVSNAFRYYLLENKWENLKPLPIKSSFVSCIAKNNKILLSGKEHSKIYCYDIIQNIYIEMHNIQTGKRKIVCGNDKNAYVIETGGYIYEGNHEWKVWNTIGSSGTENNDLIGYSVAWQNKVYFAFCNHNLYEFDMKEKKCKKIKKI